MKKILLIFLSIVAFEINSQELTNSSNLDITKDWSQEPNGHIFPVNVFVPNIAVPDEGFPVCILLHGNGGNGGGMVNRFRNVLDCHVLLAPTGYLNSWNICGENSDAPDVEMITELIEMVQGYSNINPNQIRILGSSNGAGLANRIYIENENSGIDIICSIVSHLNEPQYHNGDFYLPSGVTDPELDFCGYGNIANPSLTRRYLSISNENDAVIPYAGGPSVVGVNFVPAEEAAFVIAQNQGYAGDIITGDGNALGDPAIYEYAYLGGHVTHIRGDAGHGTNPTQIEYIKDFFSKANSTLAIELSDFSGVVRDNEIYLNWESSIEINHERYDLEKSIDGSSFYTIATVSGKGDSNTSQYYSFVDSDPAEGANYYRLRQFDKNGQDEFSSIIAIDFESLKGNVIRFFPNPTTSYVHLERAHSSLTNCCILNTKGEQIKINQVEGISVRIDFTSFPVGLYLLVIDGQMIKIIKN